MSGPEDDVYKDHGPTDVTMSPQAVTPERAAEEVERRARSIVAAMTGEIRPYPQREPATPLPEKVGARRSWRRLAAWSVGALATTISLVPIIDALHTSKEEKAAELIARGKDPVGFCNSKGGALIELAAHGITDDGKRFLQSSDTPWDRFGQQAKLRSEVNDLGLAADGKVQVCEVGDPNDGHRQVLYIVPGAQDIAQLQFVVNHKKTA